MVNYPKEMKSKLRKMTGVATDLMDLIDIYEGEPSITGEEEAIITALKGKTMFWKSTTILEDFCEQMRNSNMRLRQAQDLIPLMLSIINIKQAAVEYKLVLPAFAYTLTQSGNIDYRQYVKLQVHLNSHSMHIYSNESEDNLKYAICLSFLDAHMADQRLLPFFFKDLTPRKRDAMVKQVLLKGDLSEGEVKKVKIELPQLKAWSKMYKGERGLGGNEQASVCHSFAVTTKYNGVDFIVKDPTGITQQMNRWNNNKSLTGVLMEELQRLIETASRNVLKFGTQGIHSTVELDKDNSDLGLGSEIDLTGGRVMAYYSRTTTDDRWCHE
ncbi:hypothetical protein JTE90_019201 [Oedothorax gibbosus]|uniref:Uncharacterized protein n=1 Tax=Oedothorax gibbosus TaxID=931172 RepID=A0AAV6TNX6_9ARAC|nr:hypothetical protein JTE90_019201 [Oedothorax gibbosus]